MYPKSRILITWLLCSLFPLGLSACTTMSAKPDAMADSHFHIANYAMQGIPLKKFIDKYMQGRVSRAAVAPLPLEQKWDYFEHYGQDKLAPNYYLGPKASLYYYSFIDAMLAVEYQKLSPVDQARVDPMIVGFNPMDQYGVNHIKRLLLLYPGVFSGIGEFSIHKEIVADKIADDPVSKTLTKPKSLPPDLDEMGHNSLYNPALHKILNFAAESGLIANIHSDIYPAKVSFDGKKVELAKESRAYIDGMKALCQASPKARVYWAHTGLGRFVKPTPQHLKDVAAILDACPLWLTDLSWDLVQQYIVNPKPDMPTFAAWVAFVRQYQDRILWGSDTVIYTKNSIDDLGKVTLGHEMAVADYEAVVGMMEPLWQAIGPEAAHKIRYANHERLFQQARLRVRSWEQAHRDDNVWDLPVPL